MKAHRHHKITIIFTLIVIIVLVGLYFFLNTKLTQYAYQRLKADLISKAALSLTYLESRLPAVSREGYDQLADTIGQDLGLRVTIIAPDGTLWGDSDVAAADLAHIENHLFRPEVQAALRGGIGESLRFSTTLQKQMLYIGYPFSFKGEKGVLRLALPLSEMQLISHTLRKFLLLGLFLALIFAFLIGYAASVFISRPLKEVSDVARSIAFGDLSRRVLIDSSDEIGDLARLINYMSEQISSRMEEVVAHKSRLEAVLLSMFEGVIVIDVKGCILLINDPLRDVFSLEGDPRGKKPLEVIRNIEIQHITDQILNLHSGFVTQEISVFLEEEKRLLVHATPVVRDKQIEGAVLVFHDITDLRKLEKIRQEFVANVSHELRTPIASIKGYAETLIDGAIDDRENALDFIKIIYSNAGRLAQLISDLLDLARIESGKLTFHQEICDVYAIVEKTIESLGPLAEQRNIRITNNILPSFPKMKTDRTYFAQVFFNLIENAIKYNREDGWVEISAKENEECCVFFIKDSGIGISPNELPRVFERFYRVDKARSRKLGGTGLGLSIVKHIVQAQGGQVSAESSLGAGSTFSFSLPKT